MNKKNIHELFWTGDFEVINGEKKFIIKDFAGNKVTNLKSDYVEPINEIVTNHNNALAETIKVYNR